MQTQNTTHEAFIAGVARLAASRLSSTDRAKVEAIKLVYGAGPNGTRGITYYNRWKEGNAAKPFVEICAFTQESWVQIAGTTIHELGHVLAGWEAGHGKGWHEACAKLGLRRIKAAGTAYGFANFEPELREAIAALPRPMDGLPVANLMQGLPGGPAASLKPCGAGRGTRGGKSFGVGSGSRLRLFECECVPPVKARVARDEFAAHCDCCSGPFHLVVK